MDDLDSDSGKEDEDLDIPDEFLCPVTREVMANPVVTLAGHTYEREAIEEWFIRHATDPLTGSALPSKTLIANHALRKRIESYFRTRQLTIPSKNRSPLRDLLHLLKKHSAETFALVTTFDTLNRHRTAIHASYPSEPLISLEKTFRKVQGEIVQEWTTIFYNVIQLATELTVPQLINVKTSLRMIAAQESILSKELGRFFESIGGHALQSDDGDDIITDIASVGVLVGAMIGANTGGTTGATIGSVAGPVGTVAGAAVGFYFGAVAGAAPPALLAVLRSATREKETGLHTVWRSCVASLGKMNTWLLTEGGMLSDINDRLDIVITDVVQGRFGSIDDEKWREDACGLYEELNARVSRVEEQKQLNEEQKQLNAAIAASRRELEVDGDCVEDSELPNRRRNGR